jgi:endonuclease-3 related protein
MRSIQEELLKICHALLNHFGPRNWWPAETKFEVIVGAILTQFVAWRNVEQAISALKQNNLLSPKAIYEAEDSIIEEMIRPTRFYKQKRERLKEFCGVLVKKYDGDLNRFLNQDVKSLRKELLSIKGIGPETADSIMLYAGEKPVFVVDAYTRRIFHRLGYFKPNIDYNSMQEFFVKHLPRDVELYNEYHALIDALGNKVCKKVPVCKECPLTNSCKFYENN